MSTPSVFGERSQFFDVLGAGWLQKTNVLHEGSSHFHTLDKTRYQNNAFYFKGLSTSDVLGTG